MNQKTNIEETNTIDINDILVISPDAWDMSYDLEASQKKLNDAIHQQLQEAREDERAKILKELKTLFVFKTGTIVGSHYSDAKMRGDRVESVKLVNLYDVYCCISPDYRFRKTVSCIDGYDDFDPDYLSELDQPLTLETILGNDWKDKFKVDDPMKPTGKREKEPS